MLHRRFGRTQLQMPVFSCGGMRYQFKWQDTPLAEVPQDNQRNLEATIRRAVELGINHIETARGYGSSERQLGLILPRLPRAQIIVQTKVGPEEDPAKFTANFEESLARLQLDYVDLLALHGVNDEQTLHWSIRPGGCLEAARRLQRRGLARHIGFSTHGSTETILAAIRAGGDDPAGGFDYVNLHWYYIYQRNWPAVVEATRRDMGVFIISPSDKGGMLYQPSPKLVELCRPLHPIVFNDLFCLARSRGQAHTLSIGAARPTDFDLHLETLKVLDRAEELLPPIVARLEQALRQGLPAGLPAEAAGKLADPWGLDLPRWEDAPGNINIPIVLWLLNLARAYDMTAYGKMRYNLLGNGGHWFPGQNAARVDEVDLSAVAARCGLGAHLAPLLKEAHTRLGQEAVKRLSQS